MCSLSKTSFYYGHDATKTIGNISACGIRTRTVEDGHANRILFQDVAVLRVEAIKVSVIGSRPKLAVIPQRRGGDGGRVACVIVACRCDGRLGFEPPTFLASGRVKSTQTMKRRSNEKQPIGELHWNSRG